MIVSAIFQAAAKAMALVLLATLLAAAPAHAQQEPEKWFETEALNTGLAPAPEDLERETPRDTVDAFLTLTADGRFAEAAHVLNLNGIDAGQQAEEGPRLAQMLAEVIERRVIIKWSDLPSRPDAINAALPESHPFSGEARRSLVIGELNLHSRPVSIRLNRIKPADEDAVWVFSRQTVAEIPRLHELYGPGWFESKLPPVLTQEVTADLRAWELIVFPILAVLALASYMLLNRLFGSISRRVSVAWINRASEKTRRPLALAVTALIVQYVVQTVFTFSSMITAVLSPLLVGLVIFGITFAVLKAIDATLEIVTDRYVGEIDSVEDSDRRHLYTNIYAARRYVLLAAFVISAVLLLYNLNLFDNIGMSLLASAGVATVVLGIAGQSVLGNILASLQIAVAKPIRIGDAVQYEGRWAYVESIYYTYITLRCWDDRRLIVPVKHFISQPFENWTKIDAKSTRTFAIELDLSADPQTLREVFEEIVEDDPDVLADEMKMVAVEEYRQTTQTVRFYATAANPSDAWMMHARLSEKMGDWIRENRPEWWPRLRLAEMELSTSGESRDAPTEKGRLRRTGTG